MIGLGTWGIGTDAYSLEMRGEEKIDLLRKSIDKGIRYIDSSDFYGNAEELIGEALKGRKSLVKVCTKGGLLKDKKTGKEIGHCFEKEYIEDAIQRSMIRLGREYIEIYLLHSPERPWDAKMAQTIEHLKKEKLVGRLGLIGISVKSPKDAIIAIDELDVDIVCVNLSLLDQRVLEMGIDDRALKKGKKLILRTVLSYGYLGDEIRRDASFKENDHRLRWSKAQRESWAMGANKYALLASANGLGLDEMAIRFIFTVGECLEYAAIGMHSESDIQRNTVSAGKGRLPKALVKEIQDIYKQSSFFI